MTGTVGVVTRTKNRPVILKRALESVLGQSYDNWTMVIVNDGGEAATVDRLVAQYDERAHGRIRIIHNPVSLGMEAASNVAIRAMDCDYLVIHDDDDSWSPEFLTIAVAELEHAHALYPRVMGVVAKANAVYERIDGNVVTIERTKEYKPWIKHGLISLDAMLSECLFAPIQFLFRSEVVGKTGLYREDLPVLGDWDFNIRFMLNYDIMLIPQVLAFHHHRGNDLDSQYGNTIHAKRDRHEFVRQLLKNEWLRHDIGSGSASLGYLVHARPQMEQVDKRMDQLLKKVDNLTVTVDDLTVRVTHLEARRDPFTNLLHLAALWARSGRAFHYVSRFAQSLSQRGLRATLQTVREWFSIQRNRLNRP